MNQELNRVVFRSIFIRSNTLKARKSLGSTETLASNQQLMLDSPPQPSYHHYHYYCYYCKGSLPGSNSETN